MSLLSNGEVFVGKLYKRGRINKSFKERYFRVYRMKQRIDYYDSEDKANANLSNISGSIDLGLCQRIEVLTANNQYNNNTFPQFISCNKSKSDKDYTFQIITPNRTFVVAAINEIDLFKWLQYLHLVVFGGIIREGWLKKQEGSAINKSWKLRYCVLNKYNQLKYYNNEKRYRYLGFIDCNTLSSVSNGKLLASDLGFILDLYTKYGNVWYIGCKDVNDRNLWSNAINNVMNHKTDNNNNDQKQQQQNQQQPTQKHVQQIFNDKPLFNANCKTISNCHSIARIIKCFHIFNGNGDVNKLLSQNSNFVKDYTHILSVHFDKRNEYQNIYNYIIQHIRQTDLQQNNDNHVALPDETQKNSFYVNAMYVMNCYFFGNLV